MWRSRLIDDAVAFVIPATVVQDTDEVVALFQHPGSVCKRRTGVRGGPRGRQMIEWDGGHADRPWNGPGVGKLHVRGTSFAVHRSWTGSRYEGWYVNLELPWRSTPVGYDSRDLILDVDVSDDLSTWSWKDEDELAWALDTARVSEDVAREIRAAGESAIALIEARAFPFVDDWSAYAPDAGWPVPVVPQGWDARD